MSEQELEELAEWAAENMRDTIRQAGHEIDELGLAILYLFIRKLLVEYWLNDKTEFVDEEMRNLCFSLCRNIPTQTEEEAITACEIFAKEYAVFIGEFEKRRHQESQQILENMKKHTVFVNAKDLEFEED